MSLRLTAPSEDILGANYKITKIVASDYNPNIDSTITVTVTVKDVYDDPVENESVQVTCNIGKFTKLNGSTISDTQSVTGNTDSNGQFTLTYSCTEWGLVSFSANTTSNQIRVTGFKVVTGTNQTYYVGEDIVHFRLHQNSSLTIPTSWRDLGNYVGASARPDDTVQFIEQYGSVILRIKSNGNLEARSITGSSVTASSLIAYANWKI